MPNPPSPGTPPPNFTVVYACRCGARIKARQRLAGRLRFCCTCLQMHIVPNLSLILRLNPDLPVIWKQNATSR